MIYCSCLFGCIGINRLSLVFLNWSRGLCNSFVDFLLYLFWMFDLNILSFVDSSSLICLNFLGFNLWWSCNSLINRYIFSFCSILQERSWCSLISFLFEFLLNHWLAIDWLINWFGWSWSHISLFSLILG